jgi:hypothetical protein
MLRIAAAQLDMLLIAAAFHAYAGTSIIDVAASSLLSSCYGTCNNPAPPACGMSKCCSTRGRALPGSPNVI